MGKGAKVILSLVIVAIVVVGAVVVVRGTKKTDNSNGTGSSQSGQTPSASTDNTPANATVTYKDSGFEPALSTIKAGQTIKLVNSSNSELQVASDPHPVHTNNTELNVGVIAKGDSRSVTLNNKGSWGFHNHLNPTDKAKVDVQ